MDVMLILFSPCISVLILYALNKKFSYKQKLIKLFGSALNYRLTLAVINIIIFAHIVLNVMSLSSPQLLFITISCSFFYLSLTPEELR